MTLFESLKKKFSETSGKLRNKVETEAKEENNLELIEEEIEEKAIDSSEDIESMEDSVDDNEEDESVEMDSAEEDKFDFEDSEEDPDDISEEDLDAALDELEEAEEDPEKEKSGFFSRFRRNKNEDKKSDEEIKDKSEDLEETEESDEINGESEDLEIEESDETKDESVDLETGESDDTKEESSEEEEPLGEEEKSKGRSFFRRGSKDKKESKEDSEGEKSKRGFLSFIKEKSISEDDVEDILFELELGLLEADVAMDVATKIVESVKEDLVGQKIKRGSDVEEYTINALKKAISEIIDIEGKSMTEMLEEKVAQGEPLVVMLVGINGTGKTTTIGKLCNFYIKKGYTPVIAASDTFRAGAIEQIQHHADNLGVKLIKHEKGSDPAAVAFDAVQHAKAKGKEIVFIDTAGRMQTNTNLMDEMKKIRRVSKPDLVVFVGDALTGNDATEQASKFNDAIDIDGVILTKADADSKGGASLSIGYVIQKPILFLGMGQSYDDIKEYDADWMLEQIFS